MDAPVAGHNAGQEVLCCALGGILTQVWYPAAHRVSRTVLPCTVWGQPCSPSQQVARDQRAGLGFLDGPCEVPQSCLRGRLFSQKKFQ